MWYKISNILRVLVICFEVYLQAEHGSSAPSSVIQWDYVPTNRNKIEKKGRKGEEERLNKERKEGKEGGKI